MEGKKKLPFSKNKLVSVLIISLFFVIILDPIVNSDEVYQVKIDNFIIDSDNNILSPNQEFIDVTYYEDALYNKDGSVSNNLIISIPPSEYASIYRKALGINETKDKGEKIPIPENNSELKNDTIIITSGRDDFFSSLEMEQWYFFGKQIYDLNGVAIPYTNDDGLKILIESKAALFTKTKDPGNFVTKIGPGVVNNKTATSEYISLTIGLQKMLLNSLPGNQKLRRVWITNFSFPESTQIDNIKSIMNKNWSINFGKGTTLESVILNVKENSFQLRETLIVSEDEQLEPVLFHDYKTFEVHFTCDTLKIPNTEPKFGDGEKGSSGKVLFRFDKKKLFCFSKTLTKDSAKIQCDFLFDINFYILITTQKAVVGSVVDGHINTTTTFTDDFTYDTDYNDICKPLRWRKFIFIGWLPVWFDVEIGPEYRLIAEAYNGTTISCGAWIHGELEMGAKFTLEEGFDIIWDPVFDYDFYEPNDQTNYFSIMLKPSVSLPIKGKIYSVLGPVVRPEIYLLGTFLYDDILLWDIKLGFNLNIGVCIGIPYIWEKCCEWTMFDYTIKEWNNTPPAEVPDNKPPITSVEIYPLLDPNYYGTKIRFWFNVSDEGNIPSGLKYTWYKFNDDEWDIFNYSEPQNYSFSDPEEENMTLYYFSVDKKGNVESIRTENINIDYIPPVSSYSIGPPSNNKEIFSYHTPITLSSWDNLTGSEIWYRIGHKDEVSEEWEWSLWKNEITDPSFDYYFTEQKEGLYYLEFFAMDGVLNKENIHNESFYVHTQSTKVFTVLFNLQRICQIDDIDIDGGADWYYYIGFSENDTFFNWINSSIPISWNTDDILLNDTYIYYTDKENIYIDILLCEKGDDLVGEFDNIADISNDSYGGVRDYANPIIPLINGTYGGSCLIKYNISEDNIINPYVEKIPYGYNSSGEFDNNLSHQLDAFIWFNISKSVNYKPIADFDFFPDIAKIEDVIQFTDLSSDPDGSIISWKWDFDDNTSSNEQNPTHFYIRNGTYNVTLTVKDNNDAISQITKNITILPRSPIVFVDDDFSNLTPGWNYDHFNLLQGGIDAVADYGTIYVFNGTYFEDILINKTIDLIGEEKNTTIIEGTGLGDVVTVISDEVNISNFKICGGWFEGSGIYLHSNFNMIMNNIFSSNECGMYVYCSENNILTCNNFKSNFGVGIFLYNSNNTNIIGNKIDQNGDGYTIGGYGVELVYSINNSVNHNIISNNGFKGILLSSSSNNNIFNNNISGHYYGIYGSFEDIIHNNSIFDNCYGIYTTGYDTIIADNIISNNNIDGIYLGRISGGNIIKNNDVNNNTEGIKLYWCAGNSIKNNEIKNNNGIGILSSECSTGGGGNSISGNTIDNNADHGICILGAVSHGISGNRITNNNGTGLFISGTFYVGHSVRGNTIDSNNQDGIRILGSSDGTYTNNIITNNNDSGIFIESNSNFNTLYYNIFLGNGVNAYSECSNNWDYNNEGNYWSDYTGTDSNGDGIGEVPYSINGGDDQDHYPFMHPYGWDTTNPLQTIDIGKPIMENVYYTGTQWLDLIGSKTHIWINSTDTQSGPNFIKYKILKSDIFVDWDNQSWIYVYNNQQTSSPFTTDTDLDDNTISIEFSLNENCFHEIHAHCVDITGNWNYNTPLDFLVDYDAPSNDEFNYIGSNFLKDGVRYLNNKTIKRIYVNDTGCSGGFAGVNNISWYIGDKNNQIIANGVLSDNNIISYDDENISVSQDMDLTCGKILVDLQFKTEEVRFIYHKAFDNLENANNASNEQIYVDLIPPRFNNIYDQSDFYIIGNDVDIFCNVSDNESGLEIVNVIVEEPLGTITNYSMNLESGEYLKTLVFSNPGFYEYHIFAKDNVKNTIVSETKNFTITVLPQNTPPCILTNPYPSNGAKNIDTSTKLKVMVYDPEDDNMNITFFNANDDSIIGSKTMVNSNTTISITWSGLSYETTYNWYVKVNDSQLENTSTVWSFTTKKKQTSGGGGGNGVSYQNSDNLNPTADTSAGEPYIGIIGELIKFNGSASKDNDGFIQEWFWNFGDGSNATGEIVNHFYSNAGTYTVTLTVTDNDDAKDTCQTLVSISQPNRPPQIPKVLGPSQGSVNIQYNYSFISLDYDNDTIQYIVKWDDNSSNISQYIKNNSTQLFSHIWPKSGVYFVEVIAVDELNASSAVKYHLVCIDVNVHFIEDIINGYLLDNDQDGVFDIFHNNETHSELAIELDEDNRYLIDFNNNGSWDYTYNEISGLQKYSLKDVSSSIQDNETNGFTMLLLIMAIIALIIEWKRNEDKH